ncbi:unnamed protein product [Rotaria socialis]|uniref:Uncharacterized protein n=3 Tax=Rotaria socialis TaxID=392032 RepID=A0A820TF52_9BILA|nr:unnamed protein product [Rotaria socialis]CAF3665189.1 unnamed protein product [Rotaria socialis]CAF4465095.1 unnamed protein product [Rotaria socialis]CAF4597882.1 unnamed protein product [Rotaria socialis]
MSNITDTNNQQTKMRSVKLQTKLCISPSCEGSGEIICHHCSQAYCRLCFLCHRKNVLDDMRSIHEQMSSNRRVGVAEVTTFIDQQAKDAHEHAKKLIDDAIDRIVKASKNIHTYIENRREAKLGRLDECLEEFDKDSGLLEMQLQNEIFLSADTILELRHKYAYNMFDTPSASTMENRANEIQRKNEVFFEDYRLYKELINLREKWTFFRPALTTVYFPQKKDISLDKVLTFLEYRHDRVLDNYREFLSNDVDSKELSLKPVGELFNALSFLSTKMFPTDNNNFTCIDQCENEVDVDEEQHSRPESDLQTGEIKQETDITPKIDSGNCDDETNSTSSNSWQIEDAANDDEYDCETQYRELSQSMKILERKFVNDLRLVINQEQAD